MAEGHLNRSQMEVLKQRKYDLMLEKTHSWYASSSFNSQTQPRQKFEIIHTNGIATWFCNIPFFTLFPEIAETRYNSFSPLHNNLTDVEQEEEEEDEYEEECEQ